MSISTRAQNWLNDVTVRTAFVRASGAALLRVCPSDDPAGPEVRAAVETEDRSGWLYARVSAGDTTCEDEYGAKSAALKAAENAFLALCGTLGFQGKATTEQCQDVLLDLAETDFPTATALGLRLLAAMNEIREQGGTWAGIPEQPHEV